MTEKQEAGASQAPGEVLAVLPLRDIVVFPHMIVPLFVGREKSVKALEDVMKRRQADTARHAEERQHRTTPPPDDIYQIWHDWRRCFSC